MFNSQRPNIDDLPTSRQLVRATAISAAAAGALLITVVLPAEYAIDPTGIGGALGFTEMGEIKAQLAQEAAADRAATALTAEAAPAATAAVATKSGVVGAATGVRSDVTELTLTPGQGAEIKATMAEGTTLTYDWSVSGGAVNYDTHADAPGIDYHGYDKGTNSAGERGQLVAPFDGKHGWFWRNRGDGPVTVAALSSRIVSTDAVPHPTNAIALAPLVADALAKPHSSTTNGIRHRRPPEILDEVDRAGFDSFPASDPPPWTRG